MLLCFNICLCAMFTSFLTNGKQTWTIHLPHKWLLLISNSVKKSLGVGNPLTSLTRHMFVPVLSQDLDFQRHMSWSFCVQLVQLRSEVIVCFVDIGGIDDYHCLSFLFIINNMCSIYHCLTSNKQHFSYVDDETMWTRPN